MMFSSSGGRASAFANRDLLPCVCSTTVLGAGDAKRVLLESNGIVGIYDVGSDPRPGTSRTKSQLQAAER